MIRLIVNADDLGSSARRDRGILEAFACGIVSSASLLATGTSFASAARAALSCGLPVGVHLNLSEGRALTGPIRGLTDASGDFPGKAGLRALLTSDPPACSALRLELLAQIDRVRTAGIEPDHLDTHQHCQLFPALSGIIVELAATTGIRAVRLPAPAAPPRADEAALLGVELSSELLLYRRLAPVLRRRFAASGLWSPDGLWGMELLNRLDRHTLADTLAQIPPGTWELMTHPGYCDPADPFGGAQRETELLALCAPAIHDLVTARAIALCSFGACACAC